MSHVTERKKSSEVCVRTIDADRGNFNIFEEVQEIDPQQYPVVHPQTFNETEHALEILERGGYQPKVFCVAEQNDHSSSFEVKSDQWDWGVTPLTVKEVPFIPSEKIKLIGILVNCGVSIKGVALATPIPKENLGDVIGEEYVHELKTLVQTVKISLFLIASIFRNSTRYTATQLSNNHSVNFTKVPDPVLLVRVNSDWIEIGRW